jgi:tetratricopeptide (TPR) repeat protein
MPDCKEIGRQITALRKSGQCEEAIRLGYAHLGGCQDSWALKGSLAWAVREYKIKNFDPKNQDSNPQDLVAAVKEIQSLNDFKLYDEVSVFVIASFEAANHLVEVQQHELALGVLKSLDKESLSRNPNSFEGRKYPSQIQRWYSGMAKTLAGLEWWEDTTKVCEEALASGLFPDDESSLWLHYRLALALVDSNPARALQEFDVVFKQKPEWWVIGNKARCFRALGREQEALDAFKTALGGINAKSIVFGVKILEEMFEIVSDIDLKTQIVQTLRKIRIDGGWPTKDKYEDMAEEVGVGDASDFSITDALSKLADREAFKNVRGATPRTKQERVVIAAGVTGSVKRLIGEPPNAGFVSVVGHGDVFIAKNQNPDLPWPPQIGAQIVGDLIKGYDKKKDRESVNIADSRLA